MWCLCITAQTSSNNHVICLLGRMSPRVYWSHSFLFYYLRDAVSGILDCAKIADGFQIAEGLWKHWPVAPPLHRFTLHCIRVYGGPISFSIALKLLWYGRVSSLLQSVWAWCVGAILWIPLQSYRLPQDCQKYSIQSQSPGLQISRSWLREDCDKPKELFLGIAGHREDCRGPQSTGLGLHSSLGSDLTDSR